MKFNLKSKAALVRKAFDAIVNRLRSLGVEVPDGVKLQDVPALIKKVPSSCMALPGNPKFREMTQLTELTVPDANAFAFDWSDLSYCFYNCYNLKTLVLPDGFGEDADSLDSCFNGCTQLSSLTLGKGFGVNATNLFNCFYNCGRLTSLSLPDGFGSCATNLSGCFTGCSSLAALSGGFSFKTSVDLSPTAIQVDLITFLSDHLQDMTGVSGLFVLTVNKATYEKYRGIWSDLVAQFYSSKNWTLGYKS